MIKKGDVHSHPTWRSEECAMSSTRRIVRLAEQYNKKAHVLHITTKQEITKGSFIDDYEYHYNSVHTNKDNDELKIYHLMFDLSENIQR